MRLRPSVWIAACGLLSAGIVHSASEKDDWTIKKQSQALAAGQVAIRSSRGDPRAAEGKAGSGRRRAPPAVGPQPGSLVSTAGAPAKGAPHAKVTIVEFSDYQCPFCARAPVIRCPRFEGYIDTGKVSPRVSQHAAGSDPSQAFKAHEAAFVRRGQGKYGRCMTTLGNQRALARRRWSEC